MKKKVNFLRLAKLAAKLADDKKAGDIVILNVAKLTIVAEYFLIATAESTPQINAVIGSIEDELREKEGIKPIHIEGKGSPSWAVIDYGGLVVHVMTPAIRNLYSLERIWSDARKIKYTEEEEKPKKKAKAAK